MNDLKWTKFKVEIPYKCEIFITDWVSVWIGSPFSKTWIAYGKDNPDYAWAIIPIPALPEEPKNLHRCESQEFECIQGSITGRLTLRVKVGGWNNIYVNYCPFCGFSMKEDK